MRPSAAWPGTGRGRRAPPHITDGARKAVGQRVVPLHQLDRARQIALVLLALLQRPTPEAALRDVAALEGEDDRQVILPSRKSSPMLLPSTTSRAL